VQKRLQFFLLFIFNVTLFSANVDDVWNVVEQGKYKNLPQYKISYSKLFIDGVSKIAQDANRTLKSYEDILPPFEKLAHPNGICFRGEWEIEQENSYSGYFKKGIKAPIIVRISSAMSNTKSTQNRSFGFAGKIFSIKNENAKSANFFLIDDLGGTTIPYFSQTTLTNAPELSFSLTVLYNIFYALEVSDAFTQADKNPTIRELYEISSLDENSFNIKTPKFMKLEVISKTDHTKEDFREELHLEKGEKLELSIFISKDKKEWQNIGKITLLSSVVSLACDKQLHFHHPKTSIKSK